MAFSADDTLTKATYNQADSGDIRTIFLGTDTLALQSVTWSGLNELLQPAPSGAANAVMEDYPMLFSDVDTLGIANEGDGVRFDRIYEWLADQSTWIYKYVINICVALSVTALLLETMKSLLLDLHYLNILLMEHKLELILIHRSKQLE